MLVDRRDVRQAKLPVLLRISHLLMTTTSGGPAERRLLHQSPREVPRETCNQGAPHRVTDRNLLTSNSAQRSLTAKSLLYPSWQS